ncbi:MAG: fibronectin type III domain-containing protein [Kofleriaceae bacterium]
MKWLALGILAVAGVAHAGERECRILDLSFVPSVAPPSNAFAPQIVAWIEDSSGTFVDTVYITQATGSFGIGNRPGRFDFNSGPLWPYGRRTTVFPVWSNKQPLRWPQLIFQDSADDNLSHLSGESSRDLHFCRPVQPTEFDAMTCPSEMSLTDKGTFSAQMSTYPPRNDLSTNVEDSISVEMFAALNPFDAVSQPTPTAGVDAAASYAVSPDLPAGDYVLWVEVSKEFDFNDTFFEDRYPPPQVAFDTYGKPYRGQPSVVYRVPFALATKETSGFVLDYAGYSDPDGIDGAVRPPDSSISTDPGSGAGRLAIKSVNGEMYRVHVAARHEIDDTPPDAPSTTNLVDVSSTKATVSFIAPGDDGVLGNAKGYEVRFRIGEMITEANFDSSTLVTTSLELVPSGQEQQLVLEGLLPETEYSIGIRAFDNCRNTSPLVVIPVTTSQRLSGEVDACFIATAAYGSVMARDVELLRGFRNSVLAKSVLGELAIEAYYTFGPSVAQLVGESELLRASARGALAPIVDRVKGR